MPDKSQYFVGLDLGKRSDFSALAVLEKTLVAADGSPPVEHELRVLPVTAGIKSAEVAVKAEAQPRLYGRYDCQLLQRFDLQTPYPNIVERVAGLFTRPELQGQTLVVDKTGVGEAVCDMFARAKGDPVRCPKCHGTGVATRQIPGMDDARFVEAEACLTCGGEGKILLNARLRPVTITAGSNATPDGAGFRVAKKQLVSILQVVLQAEPGRLRVDPSLKYAKTLVDEMTNFKVKITESANESFESWRERDHDDLVLALAIAIWTAERGVQQFWMR